MFKRIIRNSTFRKIIIFLMGFVSLINKIIPKDKNTILFYDGTNKTLIDNSEALLVYFADNGIAGTHKIFLSLPANKSKTVNGWRNVGALGGVLKYLRAKYVFFCFGDMRIKPSKNQMVINLWHGMPLKRIGKLCNDKDYQDEVLNSFTYVTATSEYFKPLMAKAFGVDESKVLLSGQCRCDFFQKNTYTLDKVIPRISDYQKAVLWMPTFRVSTNGRFNDSKDFNSDTGLPIAVNNDLLKALNDFCEENSIMIVIKSHRAMTVNMDNMKNIVVITNEDLNEKQIYLYEFIKDFDALITDYSSIYFDYLLLDKPICFTLDDIESYKKGRGFIVDDPTLLMPGTHAYELDSLLSFLGQIRQGKDDYRDERKRMNDLFNQMKTNACSNLVKMIGLTD